MASKVVDRKKYRGDINRLFGLTPSAGVKVGVFGAKGEAEHGNAAQGVSSGLVKSQDEFKRKFGRQKIAQRRGRKGAKQPTVAQIAVWHEFGTSRIPARSFVRAYVDSNINEIRAVAAAQMRIAIRQAIRTGQPITDATREKILGRIGAFMKGGMQARIARGIAPPLAEKTLQRKMRNGRNKATPLINTGQLRASIDYLVSLTGKF